jgi:hypothetical protein
MLPNRLFLLTIFSLFTLSLTAQSVIDVSGIITQNTTWTSNNTYRLVGFVYVKNGATLTIQPGTVIKGDKATKGTLIITRGSKIMAQGTRQQPIVFTSDQPTPAPGDWGGIVICGYAPTNISTNGIPCLGVAEGGINTTTGDALFGSGDQTGGCGAYNNDNSGVMRFVRIEYPGVVAQTNREINGLTLAGVGSGTTIEYIQVAHSLDDGFEWFGGTVNCRYLVAYGNRDDDFDCDLGFSGHIQFALAIRKSDFADVSGSHGIEVDNNETGTPALPKTRPTFSNVTIIGPSGTPAVNYRRSAMFRRNSEPGLFNSVLIGEFPIGLCLDGVGTVANAQNDLLEVKNCYVADSPELLKTSEPTFNINQWFATSAWSNNAMSNSAAINLQNPFDFANPDPQPTPNSTLNNHATFNYTRLQHSFFQQVPYSGALATGQDWTCGWVRYEALNTDCISTVFAGSPGVQSLLVAPTLTNQYFNITLTLDQPTDLQVLAYSTDGRVHQTCVQRHRTSAGEHQIEVSVAGWPAGVYLLSVEANGIREVRKIVVQP